MPNPEMVAGLRQPRSVRIEEMRARADAKPEPAQVTAEPGVTVYVSNIRRYRVQVTAPRNYSDPTTGRKVFGGQMIAAQFDEGVYRNNERSHDAATRKMIDETLQSNPYFGKFGTNAHFWFASDQNASIEASRIAGALRTLKSLPKEVLAQYAAEIAQGTAEDHELPPIEPAKAGIRPI